MLSVSLFSEHYRCPLPWPLREAGFEFAGVPKRKPLASANRCMEKEQVQVDSPYSDRMVDFFAAYAIDIIESFMPFSIPE